jgi:hypothetical protein
LLNAIHRGVFSSSRFFSQHWICLSKDWPLAWDFFLAVDRRGDGRLFVNIFLKPDERVLVRDKWAVVAVIPHYNCKKKELFCSLLK